MSKKMQTIEIVRPGSKVDLAGLSAHVAQVCITDALAITYEVVWWSGAERRTAWGSPAQITNAKAERTTIGFAGGSR